MVSCGVFCGTRLQLQRSVGTNRKRRSFCIVEILENSLIYGRRSIENCFKISAYGINTITVKTQESISATQNQNLSARNGNMRNIGSVGITYQKV